MDRNSIVKRIECFQCLLAFLFFGLHFLNLFSICHQYSHFILLCRIYRYTRPSLTYWDFPRLAPHSPVQPSTILLSPQFYAAVLPDSFVFHPFLFHVLFGSIFISCIYIFGGLNRIRSGNHEIIFPHRDIVYCRWSVTFQNYSVRVISVTSITFSLISSLSPITKLSHSHDPTTLN